MSRKTSAPLPRVEIEWLDANSVFHHTAWTPYDEFRDEKSKCCMTCFSVGYLIREDDTRVVIAAHLSLNEPGSEEMVSKCSGTFIIPKCCIVARRVIGPQK